MIEKWKDISGFEGKYQISNIGRVRSLDRITNNRQFKGAIKTPQISNTGYYRVHLCTENRKTKPFSIHRLVATHFLPSIGGKNVVNHIDGDKLNNRLDNLEWVTISENTKHSYDTGLQIMGRSEKNPASKYTEGQIREVKKLSKMNYSRKHISEATGVSRAMIHSVLKNKSWTHV
jgi:hypothetical protein